jgi:hypothetical protein
MANYLDLAQERNFDKWNVLGTYVWPNNYIGNTYQEEVDYLKFWIDERVNWMDNNIPGECYNVGLNHLSKEISVTMYPNPVKDVLSINISDPFNEEITIQIVNLEGKVVFNQKYESAKDQIKLNTSMLKNGLYLVSVSSQSSVKQFKLIKRD